MNDAPIIQTEVNQPNVVADLQPTELLTPHFDDTAVATAQPVELIAVPVRDRRWLAFLDRPWTILPIVFITAMMGITALALTLQLRDQPHVDTAATEIQTEQTTAEPVAPVVVDTEPQKSQPRRTRTSKVRSRTYDGNSKPVARRVGVIVYRSSDP